MTERLLRAVGEGRVSVEEIVRAALREPAARDSLDQLVARTAGRPTGRVQVRRVKRYPPKLLDALLGAARHELADVDGLVGICWGTKWSRRRSTGRPCLVCLVETKHLAPSVPIPAELELVVGGRIYRVPTDVAEQARDDAPPAVGKQWSAEVASPEAAHGVLRGTVGAVVTLDSGVRVAVVSGHVAGQAGTVTIGGRSCAVRRRRDDARIDAASCQVDDPSLGTGVVRARDPHGGDVGRHVLLKLQSGPIHVEIDAVGHPATFGAAGTMQDLTLLSHAVTHPGDSGAAAYLDGQLIGFVVGVGTPSRGRPATTALEGAWRCIDAVV